MRVRVDRDSRGSVLMLVPAGILVLVLLAGIAVDSAGAFLAQRQLTDALTAAANDAATAGLDDRDYYADGALTLDPAGTATAVCTSLAAQGDGDLHDLDIEIGVAGPAVTVKGTAEVRAAFGRLIPHFGTRQISAEVTAVARPGPGKAGVVVPALTPVSCSAG